MTDAESTPPSTPPTAPPAPSPDDDRQTAFLLHMLAGAPGRRLTPRGVEQETSHQGGRGGGAGARVGVSAR